eukprot:jgi/Botrbrau1/5818/Bobra.0366s0004.1
MIGVRQLLIATGRRLDPVLCRCCFGSGDLQALYLLDLTHRALECRLLSSLPQPRWEEEESDAAGEGSRHRGSAPSAAKPPDGLPSYEKLHRNGNGAGDASTLQKNGARRQRANPNHHSLVSVQPNVYAADLGFSLHPVQRAKRVQSPVRNHQTREEGKPAEGRSSAERWLQQAPTTAPASQGGSFHRGPGAWDPVAGPHHADWEEGPAWDQRQRAAHQRYPGGYRTQVPPLRRPAEPSGSHERPWEGFEPQGRHPEGNSPGRPPGGQARFGYQNTRTTRWISEEDWGSPSPPQGHPRGAPAGPRAVRPAQPSSRASAPASDARKPLKSPPGAPAPAASPPIQEPPVIELPDDVTVLQLAALLKMEVGALEEVMASLGSKPASPEDSVDLDLAELAALEQGFLVSSSSPKGREADAEPRPAVVTVMGHVDHGKTSLLDALRKTSVAAGEAGGITQHIGAFRVVMPGSHASLTFLDTPGHAAFTAMRARGAHVTDIVVLVVDAGDGVMPQTREAIQHARDAGCPIIVALSKCDRAGANPAKVRQQLLAEGLELEDAGGDVQVVETAAVTGQGLRDLEEAVLLQAEVMGLRASRTRPAEGVVLEARLDKGQGPRATLLVRRGTLTPGQVVVVGTEWGRVRSLTDENRRPMEAALPGDAVEIMGLRGVPQAGDDMSVVASEERARRISEARSLRADQFRFSRMAAAQRQRALQAQTALADASDAAGEPAQHQVVLVVKADVQGTAEAVRDALQSLSGGAVRINVASMGVGPVTVADVEAASAKGARILAFNVKTAHAAVDATAKQRSVEIVTERVIYRLLEQAADWLTEAAPRVAQEVILGQAQILQVFELSMRGENKGARVAGCRVKEGFLRLGETFRLLRAGTALHEGPAVSLRRGKREVQQVGQDTECGLLLDSFPEVQPGDVLHCFSTQMVAPSRQDVLQAAPSVS